MNVEKPKIALFLCECSTNISNFIDLQAVADWAESTEDFCFIEVCNLLCSPDGKKFFTEKLKEHKPDGIIVAACSPKLHEKTFQDVAEEVGINMSRVQMANIRENVSWVTKDKAKATEKAKAMIKAALRRVILAEDLEKVTMEVISDILIIGGGIAGIEAALTASKAGRKVYLVEKDVSLGGSVIKTEEVAPNMECSPCLLAPRLSEVRDDANITVLANSEITDVLGFYGNFLVKVRKKARYVEETCIGCEACFDVCPVTLKSEFHLGLGNRKAIYALFPGSVPAAAVIDKQHCKHFIDNSCDACVSACPFGSINFEEKDEELEINVGALVVATGSKDGDVSNFAELGYEKIKNVYTLPEFERIASSNGPSGGKIQLRNGEQPLSIAVIHCAGSLRDDGIPYCSGTCCVDAIKVGELVRKQIPEAKVFNIHNDLVFVGPKENAFYRKQVKEGTQFIKCTDLKTIQIKEKGNKIMIDGKGFNSIEANMVVLATGLEPASGTNELADMLNIDLGKDGFFKADHDLLNETGSALEGIYIAGCSAGPCNVATSVTRARSAVGDIISKLVPGREIELEIMTSIIDEDKCGGCKLCISVCPYKAIIFDEEKNISIVTEAICRGCGTCVASCPSGAAKAKHFTDEQIYAEIGGLLYG
ncbi:MAG: CoB--CoM heterodisulfide reductase iron-sulfur subunit A family protein [Candidatus Cloacimonetes bacterium]|nr:CoB--CoM heterodisulfide reductase iron-sulfur subunit A family protein [Candidatus Cloacimonadota bacterium]